MQNKITGEARFASSATATKLYRCAGLALAAAAMMMTAHADLPAELAACQAIADRDLRLSCFDSLRAPPKSAGTLPAPAAPEKSIGHPGPKPVAVTQQPLSGPAAFGAESVPAQIVEQPKSLKATVTGNIRGVRKGMVIRLDNGQQWRSVDDREYDYEADRPEVTIERNLIGTYWMAFPDSGFRIRARRIK